jgi:hypothetical protein
VKKIATVVAAVLALAGSLQCGAGAKDKPVYFEYDEFAAVRALDPNLADARLSGMNKACMRLWKNGDMMATEHGMVVRADFNGDGQTDIAVAMEKDHSATEEDLIDYYVVAASRSRDGGLKLMQTVPLSGGHSVVEMLWDEKKNAISVDTGERQLISQSTVTMLGDGKLIGGLSKKTGDVEIRLTFLSWDTKTKKFDLSHGTFKI